jgi:16S rRNA G966 N2-methylase RsmD
LPTDYAQLTQNLLHFYDFTGKVVLFVGAGVKQLLAPSAGTKKLIAIDKDVEALRELKANIVAKGLQDSMEVLGARFEEVTLHGDVVYFEFCFHEMDDPEKALIHARALAPDIVVYDHSPGSEWIYYGAEEDEVSRSSAVMERFGIRRHQKFRAEQRFKDHAELLAKVGPQGPLAVERAQRFAGATNIVIPMGYELNLL